MKIHVFSTSFNKKVNIVTKIMQSAYLSVNTRVKHKKYYF